MLTLSTSSRMNKVFPIDKIGLALHMKDLCNNYDNYLYVV